MTLIRCDGCSGVHASTTAACLQCGRCPGCGRRRLSKAELAAQSACPACNGPLCGACARCHVCGALRTFDLPACDCGHPHDPEKLRRTEAVFGIAKESPMRHWISAVMTAFRKTDR
jgi:hypothetical protein